MIRREREKEKIKKLKRIKRKTKAKEKRKKKKRKQKLFSNLLYFVSFSLASDSILVYLKSHYLIPMIFKKE